MTGNKVSGNVVAVISLVAFGALLWWADKTGDEARVEREKVEAEERQERRQELERWQSLSPAEQLYEDEAESLRFDAEFSEYLADLEEDRKARGINIALRVTPEVLNTLQEAEELLVADGFDLSGLCWVARGEQHQGQDSAEGAYVYWRLEPCEITQTTRTQVVLVEDEEQL